MNRIVQLDLYVTILILTALFTITNSLLQSTPLLSRKFASKIAVVGLTNLENGNILKRVVPSGPKSISRLDASPRKIDVGDGISSFGKVCYITSFIIHGRIITSSLVYSSHHFVYSFTYILCIY